MYGLSPASRGTRMRNSRRCTVSAVYPRLRGERLRSRMGLQPCCGLSPASRGTQCVGSYSKASQRFIPGFAGNALLWSGSSHVVAVYPRLRGERPNSQHQRVPAIGLSPASRGTLPVYAAFPSGVRFIPGFAGNATAWVYAPAEQSVYPRLRGERAPRVARIND